MNSLFPTVITKYFLWNIELYDVRKNVGAIVNIRKNTKLTESYIIPWGQPVVNIHFFHTLVEKHTVYLRLWAVSVRVEKQNIRHHLVPLTLWPRLNWLFSNRARLGCDASPDWPASSNPPISACDPCRGRKPKCPSWPTAVKRPANRLGHCPLRWD